MNNDKKVRVIVIGNYLDVLERPLRSEENIICDCIINGCSPLAMAGPYNEANLKYCNDVNMPMPALLNLRKNLSAMLSRDPKVFNQNYNLQPYAKEVRYKNASEYIIVMNTSIGYALFEKKGTVYSDNYPQNQFLTDLKADKSYTKQSCPFSESFNWRYYYEKFIDTIINKYDSKHIILIRTNSASWYMDGRNICEFEGKASQFRGRVEELDDYFIEKTGCLVIDEQYNFIPVKKETCAFPFSSKSTEFYKRLKNDISEIMRGGADFYRYDFPDCTNPLKKRLCLKLSSYVINKNAVDIESIRANRLTLRDIEEKRLDKDNVFFADILKLREFLGIKNTFTLSDYAVSLLSDEASVAEKTDFELLKLYTKYFKLNINDIIAVYMLYSKCGSKEKFRGIVSNIINNTDCTPVNSSRKFYSENINFLHDYPYIQSELINDCRTNKFFIRIENDSYFVIDLSADDFMRKIDLKINKTADHMQIINNGYICPIESADALCQSYAFYIERAKRGEALRPVRIVFHSTEELSESLYYIDYKDILTNENFVLSLPDSEVNISEYKPICDLSFLLKKNTIICEFRGGLADQICHYTFSRQFEEVRKQEDKPEIYYDDLYYDYTSNFNGFEIVKFLKEDIGPRLMTNLLSKKLRRQINRQNILPDILYQNGCTDIGVVLDNGLSIANLYKHTNKVFIPFSFDRVSDFVEYRFDFYPLFYFNNIRAEHWIRVNHIDFNSYFNFPDFDSDNKVIADRMLDCDAVVMHIRLGDFSSTGISAQSEYYIKAVKAIEAAGGWKNKKYFIFSDNIPYVKANVQSFGLDLVGAAEIIYVDHNKSENSFYDMLLMRLAKIIISSASGFVETAAALSERCEQYICNNKSKDAFVNMGKTNRFDINI